MKKSTPKPKRKPMTKKDGQAIESGNRMSKMEYEAGKKLKSSMKKKKPKSGKVAMKGQGAAKKGYKNGGKVCKGKSMKSRGYGCAKKG